MDSATWLAFALTLTLVGGLWTASTWRKNGAGHGLRAASITMLPIAAWLTGLLRLTTEIGRDIADWAGRLVFSPSVWLGIVIAFVAAVVFGVSGSIRRRQAGREPKKSASRIDKAQRGSLGAPTPPSDDMAEIEAILRKRGIK